MRTNTRPKNTLRTHEGAPAIQLRGMDALRRAVSSCLLWENEFYEDGVAISDRIRALASTVPVADVAALAIEARTVMNLRHVSLWLTLAVIDRKVGAGFDTAALIEQVCRRADEPGELLAMYWRDGRKPIPAAMKRGLARAMLRYDSYQLAKYNRDATVSLKDVLRVTHPKAANDDRAAVLGQLLKGELASADTWEVALSGGADKKASFERLLREGKLGYLALLRNLRKMDEVGVDAGLVRDAILARKGARQVLPFRYVAAARAAPRFEPWLEEALCACVAEMPVMSGETIVLVDVSGSMNDKLSAKSDLTRMDAAATLASVIHGNVRIFSFSQYVREVPARRGMAGVDAIKRSQSHMGTYLGKAVAEVNRLVHDRLIVISDEQSHDAVPSARAKHAYMINVASSERAVGHADWTRISGFSENVLAWIHATEAGAEAR
jgi:60 kDa SS-A/Ro ribonucleoprotein